jgi:hypothetical protein
MSILESFIARVRLIKDNVITISWNNANNDLIGLKVAQESLELFERQTWAHYMNDLIIYDRFGKQIVRLYPYGKYKNTSRRFQIILFFFRLFFLLWKS